MATDPERFTPEADKLVDRVLDLCPFPATAQRLMALANDDSAPMEAIAAAVASDPALATQVLHVANSSAFRLPGREAVRDLRLALVAIGLEPLKTMASAMALLATFATRDELALDLHGMSAISGSITSAIVPAGQGAARGMPFICGLLCEVGALACLVVDGPGYVALWRRTAGSTAPWSPDLVSLRDDLETKRYGATSRTIGARLLRRQLVPADIATAIEAPTRNFRGAPLLHRATAFAYVVTPVLVAHAGAPTPALTQTVGDVAALTSFVELDAAELTKRCLAACANAERALRATRG